VLPPFSRGGALVVRFLDVGQGDSAVVATDDRHALLIDAGPPNGYRRALGAVRSLGDAALDALILTHPHTDHLGLLPDLLAREPFERMYEPGLPDAHPEYTGALAVAAERGIPVERARRGLRFGLGEHTEVTVLAPSEPLFSHTRDDLNANSVVLRIDHHAVGGDVRILFEGDAEEVTERRLLEDRGSLHADVLKVAHHGSEHATGDAFLDAVGPRLAVISCGAGNEFGHPHAQTLRRLEAHHVAIARTDLEGDVTVTSDDHGLRWTTDRQADPAELRKPGHGAHSESP
jgi:competence protein ComEC